MNNPLPAKDRGNERPERRKTAHVGGHATRANPEEFEKKTTPVRERMVKDLKETPTEERIKRGSAG